MSRTETGVEGGGGADGDDEDDEEEKESDEQEESQKERGSWRDRCRPGRLMVSGPLPRRPPSDPTVLCSDLSATFRQI